MSAGLTILTLPGLALGFTVLKTPRGVPLRWTNPIIEYQIGPLSDDAPEDEQVDAILEAAYAWEEASGGMITIEFVGFTDIDYEEREDENVIFMVKEGWPFGTSAVAITRTWGLGSGEIEAFDMHLGDENTTFSTSDIPPPGTTDLQNTVTHEFGHVLGLDHSNDPGACMYSTAVRGETSKRTLGEDDIAGLQWLYPPGSFDGSLHCNAAPGGAAPWGTWFLSLILLRRRRSKR